MPTDRRRRGDAEVTPLNDPAFRRHSVHFDDLEFQRRFEQNLIRYGLVTGEQVTKEINNTVVVTGAGGGGGGHDPFCYWVREGSNLVYYDGNVGVGVHPHSNDFEVRGNVLVEAKAEAPYVEIRNWSDTAYDPTLRWALGATPETMFAMGVDDSDANKWKIANGTALGTVAGWTFGDNLIFGDSYTTDLNRVFSVAKTAPTVITDYSLSNPYTPRGIYNCIYVHTDSSIFICDNTYGVAKFDSNLNFVTLYTNAIFTGASAVYGICYWDGYFYVSMQGIGATYDAVYKCSEDFSALTRFLGNTDSGEEDYLFNAKGICTDGTYFYVSDNGHGVKIWTVAGTYVEMIATINSLSLTGIWGIQTDGTYIYVTDRTNDRIAIMLNSDHSWVADLDTSGTNVNPWDVTMDDDYVYTVLFQDTNDNIRLMVFQKSDWSLISNSLIPFTEGGSAFTSSRGIGILKTYNAVHDLLVLHQDGSYFEVYPVTRFMDDIRLHETALTTSDYVGLAAPAAITASYTLALPVAAAGATKHLYSDAANQLAFGQDVTPTGSPSFVRATLTVAIGTAPLTVTSTTLVTNLNADLLDGQHGTYYGQTYISATSSPTVNDDINQTPVAFTEGAIWVEQDSDTVWFCADNANGAAVWHGIDQDLRTADSVVFGMVSIGPNSPTQGAYCWVGQNWTTEAGWHAFEDETQIANTGGHGYASFDAICSMNSTGPYDHLVGFQARPIYNSAGNLADYYAAFKSNLNHTGAGTVANAYGLHISDPIGTGPITNNYGIYIASMARGSALNYSIYVQGGLAYFGGEISTTVVHRGTVDGADNSYLYLAGGGAASVTRGAVILLTGNEYALKGAIAYQAGSGDGVTYGDHIWYGNAGPAELMRLTSAGYLGIGVSPGTELTLKAASTISVGTSDGADNSYLYLCGGGAASATRGAYVLVTGNEQALKGSFAFIAGLGDGVNMGSILFYANAGPTEVARFDYNGNFGLGQTTFGTSAVKVLAVSNGTAPSTAPADCFQVYSADYAAGDARCYIRAESGYPMAIGNQEFVGGNQASGNLTLRSTSNATKGTVYSDSSFDVTGDINASGVLKIDGTQVVKERQAAIADPSGGLVIDAECRAQLALALAMLRAHGLIAT